MCTGAEIAAAAALTTAAAGTYSAATTNNDGPATQSRIAGQAREDAKENSEYQRMLNTLAIKRSTAGVDNGQGSTVTYDPGSNTWKTRLGEKEQQLQDATTNANINRNTVGVRQANDANEASIGRSIDAGEASREALQRVRDFKPTTPEELRSLLIEQLTTGNREATQPVIADTLRAFARTGTAAGPVLSQLQRQSGDNLRKGIIDATISSLTKTSDVNNAERSGLVGTYQALNKEANPSLQWAPIANANPTDALMSVLASRAKEAPGVANNAAFGATYGNAGNLGASKLAIDNVPNTNQQGAQIAGVGKAASNLLTSGADAYKTFFAPITNPANNADKPSFDNLNRNTGMFGRV